MACSCKRGNKTSVTYKVTGADGKVKSYRSETEAKMQVARKGGTYEKVTA